MAVKVAIVTGASSGIGKASAIALAKAGYKVGLLARRADKLEAAVAEIKAAGGEAIAVAADVGNPAQVEAAFGAVKAKWGRLDFLFNNAGMGAPAIPMEDLTFEQWKAVLDANLTGSFLCAQSAIRIMKAQDPRGGRIVNNGSISAYAPRPHSAPYTATKHAISGLTRSIALDGRRYDIACGQIDIGNAATEMTTRMVDGPGVPQANGTMMHEPRMDVSNVANSIVHMASLPLDANILFMNVMATKMPFVGRG